MNTGRDNVGPTAFSVRRDYLYMALAAGLILFYAATRGLGWHSSAQAHTLTEVVAALLALLTGIVALVRYYARKYSTLLFVGTGFLGTALLDAMHGAVTSDFVGDTFAANLAELNAWSWTASRFFLGLMLVLGWLVPRQEERSGGAFQVRPVVVYAASAGLVAICAVLFAVVSLPAGDRPPNVFQYSEAYLPAALFVVALIGHVVRGGWRGNRFEHWLILSLIVAVVMEIAVLPLSRTLFDMDFNMAHAFKVLSYAAVFTGLLISMRHIFVETAGTSARLEAILNSVVDGIITIEADGTIVAFNPGAENIFGYAAAEVLGRNVKMLAPEPFAIHHDQYLKNYLETGAAQIIGIGREVSGLRKDGRKFPMALAVSEAGVEGQRLFVGICRDISAQKEAEHEREIAMQELESFAYSVSHDLRGPLRAVHGFTQALVEDFSAALPEEGRGYIQRVTSGCTRMSEIIDALLSLSRITRADLQRRGLDLSEMAEDLIRDLREAEPERAVEVQIEPGITAFADKKQMQVVLLNLLTNAWKFTRNAENAKIELGTGIVDDRRTFYVRDNGAGFEMDYVEKLFKPFERLHTAGEFEGTGIGLATVARVIQRHNGRIWAESEVGRGATFYFVL